MSKIDCINISLEMGLDQWSLNYRLHHKTDDVLMNNMSKINIEAPYFCIDELNEGNLVKVLMYL